MSNLGHPPLVDRLIHTIKQKGPLPFVRFMEQALYAPGLGYYSSGQQKFGKDGDFITAPELSPLFSRCLAYQCQPILLALNDPIIFEFGAGSGIMAVDILLTLETLGCLPKQYWILELSAELKNRQQTLFKKRAPHLLPIVHWLTTLPDTPYEGIVLANEVLDAMPVNKFRWESDKLQEAAIDYQAEQFVWHWDVASAPLKKAVEKLEVTFESGYESEINLFINGWIKSISTHLSRGVVLAIDYGFPRREYYHPERSMGTLMCHKQHRSHTDPLQWVGSQDITAHVDFTAVAEAAVENDFDVAGYTHQAAFLIDCGVTHHLEKIEDEIDRFNASNQVKQLTLPSEMGELFKVIALAKHFDDELLGFQTLNQLERL